MFRQLIRKRKAAVVAMSAVLTATAFTAPGGCTITVDEDLLQQVLGWVERFEDAGLPMADPEAEDSYGPGPGYGSGPFYQAGPYGGCPGA